ncbi:TerC family protein [uncultured Enterovirga sp.]|uniref:TerC family protein n=1 Tax=uncultured Enterovirga sp. TaxID=2026352 RepID=UPI0035CC9FF7
MESYGPWFVQLLQIIWIDLLLSGDNAVVIAMACRSLPPHQRKMGILLGAGAAVGLRIIFALIITQLLGIPFLKLVGGLLLVWIAVKLVVGEEAAHSEIEASDSLWAAIRTIAIADAVMSLDNVVAIAAAAKGHPELFIFGLLLSIPLIIFGATLITGILERYPFLVWLGAALLGWISGEMIVSDPAVSGWIGLELSQSLHYPAAIVGALLVLAIGYVVKRRARPAAPVDA